MAKKMFEITKEIAAQVNVNLTGGPRWETEGSLIVKDRKVGEFTAVVNAWSANQARLAICKVVKKNSGCGVKFTAAKKNGITLSQKEVDAMNSHIKTTEQKVEAAPAPITVTNISKIALVGDISVDYSALAKALNVEGKKLLVGDATNREHCRALFKVKTGTFKDVLVAAYTANHEGKVAYSPEKLGFDITPLSILSTMSEELRALLMKEALENKASVLIGNAPEPTPENPQPKEEMKPQPTKEEVREKVVTKLIELGQAVAKGENVQEEINKFGSYACQSLGMSEEEVLALVQPHVAESPEEIQIPDEDESPAIAEVNKENDHAQVTPSDEVAVDADVMAQFLARVTDTEEEAQEAYEDILAMFSNVHHVSESEGELVIEGVILRDGKIHVVAVNSELQGRILG